MKKHPIDNLFSQKLKEAEIKPRDEAWEKLQLRMQTKQRRIGGWWQQGPWLAAAGVCLLLAVGWLTWRSNTTVEAGLAQHSGKIKAKTAQPKEAPKVQDEAPVKEPVAEPEQVATHINEPESVKEPIRQSTHKALPELKSTAATVLNSQPAVAVKQPEEQKGPTQIEKENLSVGPVQTPQTVAQAATAPSDDKPVAKTVILQLPELRETLMAAAAKEVGTEQGIKEGDEAVESSENILNKPQKSTRMAKVWRQLKNAKNGERVDWEEVGFNPNKMLAKATGKER